MIKAFYKDTKERYNSFSCNDVDGDGRRGTFAVVVMLLMCMLWQNIAMAADAPSDREQYRRSSLCLILLTHKDKKYAEAMERVFNKFPLPVRYNEHNIADVRVISVKGKQKKSDIERLLRSYKIPQRVVGRWFNRRSYTGCMDMDLIHERGGYGASYADYIRSKVNVRGAAMLQDEGIELLQSTFVLVCDMDYKDKSNSFWKVAGVVALAGLSGVMEANAQANLNKAQSQMLEGNYYAAQNSIYNAQTYANARDAATAGANLVADIGGFRVRMTAWLYQLNWDDSMTQSFYNEYWVDSSTPYSEAQSRKKKFEDARNTFSLKYLGCYSETSSKTILRSWSNEDEVIVDVCERTVNKGITALAKKYPIFRPRAPFYFDGGNMYAHIGTKEEVVRGKKYDILKPYKDKRGLICFKKVGKTSALSVWDNRCIRFDRYFDDGNKGSRFKVSMITAELRTPGLQLREK